MERCIQIDGPAIQGRRHSQCFKGGAWLITVGYTTVSPLLQPGLRQCLLIGHFAGFIGLGPFRLAQVLQPQLLCFRHRIGVCQFQIVVGVIASQGGHSQNFPGVDIHHQAEGPILHIIPGNGCFHLLFQASLHRSVQRQDQAVPFLR